MSGQPCPSRDVHVPHGWPTEHGNAFYCPGVEAPAEDTSWLGLEPVRSPRDPFAGLPPVEVWLNFLAQLTGAGIAFLCAEILPRPWGLIVFLIVNAALAANTGRILLKGRRQ
jgi:hypothetical protein